MPRNVPSVLRVSTRRRPSGGESNPTSTTTSSSSGRAAPTTTMSPRRIKGGGVGGCFTFVLKFSQCILILLGLMCTVVILLPVVLRHHHLSAIDVLSSSVITYDNFFNLSAALSGGGAAGSGTTTTTTTTTAQQQLRRQEVEDPPPPPPGIVLKPNPNRTIALVHVGKAGGVSLRRITVVFCKLFFRKPKYDANRAERTRSCVERHFPDRRAALTHRTKHYFHLEEYSEAEMAASTSFLITLRNPVDRIVSTYRYSHPGNCNDGNRHQVWRPRGCEALKHRNETGLVQNEIHFKCFPSPAMEDFAQSLLRPWKRSTFLVTTGQLQQQQQQQQPSPLSSLLLGSKEDRRHCRYLAREMVQGHGTYGSAPHMLYNYAYYAQRSIWKFPNHEVFAIRTEHEWDDILELDRLLGGNGNLRDDRDVSHGSEGYIPSPLTTEAYQKLCCALEQEIEVYQDLLDRVSNLNATAKRDAMESVREKCGITTTWTEWRVQCRRKLRRDLRALKPCLIVNETKYPHHRGFRDLDDTGRFVRTPI